MTPRSWNLNIKSMLAASLGSLISLTCLSIQATDGQQNSKTLTPAQFAQMRDYYLRYQRTLQAQFRRQEQFTLQEKMRRAAQQAQNNPGTTAGGKPPHKHVPVRREDVLLVMLNKGAKPEDIKQTVESAQGEICGRFGAGSLLVILIKPKPGRRVIDLQRTLAADTRDFKHVDFNRKLAPGWIPTTEPTFSKAWNLIRMHVCDAWDEVQKYNYAFPQEIAVFDTGVGSYEPFTGGQGADTTGTVAQDKFDDLDFDGFLGTGLFSDDIKDMEEDIIEIGNNIKTLTYGCVDRNGHGTAVACVLNGSPLNGVAAAGVNPEVPVFSIKVGDGPPGTLGTADEISLCKAMCVMYDMANTHIINCSYIGAANAGLVPILHEFFKDWYYRKNGLIFVCAGNSGENVSYANQPYVNNISAMADKADMELVKKKSWQSASGTAIDFTAPGQNIPVADINSKPTTVDGTSFSTPMVAGVASMIWHINGNLKNTEVEKILRDSCENSDGPNTWNPQFGWGMPDAYKCVMAAEASLPKK